MAPTTPSLTRNTIPSVARSRSSSRVRACSVTPSTTADTNCSSVSTMVTPTVVVFWARLASLAAVPTPLLARPERTMLVIPTTM